SGTSSRARRSASSKPSVTGKTDVSRTFLATRSSTFRCRSGGPDEPQPAPERRAPAVPRLGGGLPRVVRGLLVLRGVERRGRHTIYPDRGAIAGAVESSTEVERHSCLALDDERGGSARAPRARVTPGRAYARERLETPSARR